MPLLQPLLEAELLKVIDPENPGFVGYPPDLATGAANFGTAFQTYFLGLVVPPEGPALAQAQVGTFVSTLIAQCTPLITATEPPSVSPFVPAITLYVAAIASGVSVGSALPPPAPLVLPITNFESHAEAAQTIASAVDLWVRTATYTPPVPPTPVPWS